MTLKIDINYDVIAFITSYIKSNIHSLSLVEPSNVSQEAFEKQSIPTLNTFKSIPTSKLPIVHFTENDRHFLEKAKELLNAKAITNSIIYCPNSCMTWHTNSDDPGTRIYYTYSNKLSIFRYIDKDTGQIVDDIDNVGWTARKFDITDESNPFWHTIWTSSLRFSFGFKL